METVQKPRTKKHLLAVLAGLLAVMLLAAVLGHMIYGSLYAKTYEAGYRDKLARLSSIEGEKAVFVGGSSCLFGIQAAMFEEQTGIPSVNMAISYGIPIRLYLDSAEPHLKAGDKLFFALEYGGYTSKWDRFGNAAVNFMLYSDPAVMKHFTPAQYIKLLPDLLSFGWANWENSAQEFIRYYLLGGFGVYSRDSMNAHGDMIATKGLPNEEAIVTGTMSYKYNGTTDIIRNRLEALEARGVEVYIVFEPLMEGRLRNGLDHLYAELSAWEGIDVLYAPEELLYPSDAYFNSDEHLNYEAASQHTQRIIDRYLELTAAG